MVFYVQPCLFKVPNWFQDISEAEHNYHLKIVHQFEKSFYL